MFPYIHDKQEIPFFSAIYINGLSWYGVEQINRLHFPSRLSHAQPLSKRILPALENWFLNSSKEPNDLLMDSANLPVGWAPRFTSEMQD